MAKETTKVTDVINVYEVGYHIVSSIPEEKVSHEVEVIKTAIAKHSGAIIAEEMPKKRPLAYTITKALTGSRTRYNEAYFGWVKFEMSGENAVLLKKDLDANLNILRFLFITTTRENTLVPQKITASLRGDTQESIPHKEGVVADEAPKKEVTEEDIDKSIDNLVV